MYQLIRSVDSHDIEVLLTLALATGGYAAAVALHISGPITVVVAGLLIGNHGRSFAMSRTTREYLDPFWELVDEILNAALFVLIGFELLSLSIAPRLIGLGVLVIPIALGARLFAVWLPIQVLRRFVPIRKGLVVLLSWGGLRGAISVALALSLPDGPMRNVFLTATYVVVVFSIIVQGLTMKRLIERHSVDR